MRNDLGADAAAVDAAGQVVPTPELPHVVAELLAALRKVPLFGPTEDNMGWRCAGCGGVSGIHADGTERNDECSEGCYVPIVEAAIALAEGKS